jgi:hypothetical protein
MRRIVKKGCVLYPLLFLACLAAWLALFGHGDPMDLFRRDPGSSVFAAIVSTLFVATLRGIAISRRDEQAIESARKGFVPEDGKRGAAFGEIHPSTDAVLTAPFSGRPCVACEYDVFQQTIETVQVPAHGSFSASTETRTTRHSAYTGHAFVPCEVRTPTGPVPLLTRPLLEFPAKVVEGPDALERARAWVARAQFEVVKNRGLLGELSDYAESFSRDGGIQQRDEKHLETDPDLADWILEERIVSPGETVSAVGRYSESAGGLVGEHGSGEALLLTPHGAARSAEDARSSRGCLGLVAAGLFVLLVLMLLRG